MFCPLLLVWEMRKLYSYSLNTDLTLELKIIWVCAAGPSELWMVDLDRLQTLSSVIRTHFSFIAMAVG